MFRLVRSALVACALACVALVVMMSALGSVSNTPADAQSAACGTGEIPDPNDANSCIPDPDTQCVDANNNGICDDGENDNCADTDANGVCDDQEGNFCEDIDGDGFCDDSPQPAPDPVSGCRDSDRNNVCDDVQTRPIDVEEEFCGSGTVLDTSSDTCVPEPESTTTTTGVDTNGDGIADTSTTDPQTTQGATQPNADGTCPTGTQRRVTTTGNECVTAPAATGPTGGGGTGSPTGSPTGSGGGSGGGSAPTGGGGGATPAGGGAAGGGAPGGSGGGVGGAAPAGGAGGALAGTPKAGAAPAGAPKAGALPTTAGIFDTPRGAAFVAAFQDVAEALGQGAGGIESIGDALEKILPKQAAERTPDSMTGWGLLVGAFGLIVGGAALIGRKAKRAIKGRA